MIKRAKKYVEETLGSYREISYEEAIEKSFNIIHVYDTKRYAYPDGYIGANYIKIVFFNSDQKIKYSPDHLFDSVKFTGFCDISPATVESMTIFPDGATLLKFPQFFAIPKSFSQSLFFEKYIPAPATTYSTLKLTIFEQYCKDVNKKFEGRYTFVEEDGSIKVITQEEPEEYLVFSDKEANDECRSRILEDLYLFEPEFILKHINKKMTSQDEKQLLESIQMVQHEGIAFNMIIRAMISNIDVFVSNAIRKHGRGHFLSPVNGEEVEVMVKYTSYYVYRRA